MTDTAERREPDQINGVPLPEHQPMVVGHDGVRESISVSLNAARLPGAMLLHGPQGIGKATLAFSVARDILTLTGDEDPRRVAEQVAAGSHPNLYVLRRQPKDTKGFYTVIRVDDIRALRERLRKTRGRAGYRVAVIDAIDDCNPSAANALLKTLEEPPAETMFLLISHRPGQLLPTIKSRCQMLAMRPLADADVAKVLNSNRPEIAQASIAHAVLLAEGRPRRGFEALAMTDESIIGALKAWLSAPISSRSALHVGLAETLAADPASSEAAFARDMVLEWLASEARSAAIAGPAGRRRLASANELWDKAHALFADADSYNLDARQTLVTIFDAIRRHVRQTAQFSELN